MDKRRVMRVYIRKNEQQLKHSQLSNDVVYVNVRISTAAEVVSIQLLPCVSKAHKCRMFLLEVTFNFSKVTTIKQVENEKERNSERKIQLQSLSDHHLSPQTRETKVRGVNCIVYILSLLRAHCANKRVSFTTVRSNLSSTFLDFYCFRSFSTITKM